MNSSLTLSVTTFAYGLSALCYITALIFRKTAADKAATWIAAVALVGNILGIGLRWIESYQMGYGHAPLSNLYESLVFFSAAICVIHLFVVKRYRVQRIGAFIIPLAFLAMAYASLSPNVTDRIQPLIPALKSNWLIAHVITCFLGYAGFAVAFGISILFLSKSRTVVAEGAGGGGLLSHLPDLSALDDLTYKMIQFGFLFLSVGIITGAVWANSAWGRYWGWDPKETWSLITWFVYATLLHARLMRGWRGQKIAVISIVGFMAVLFTYFGVNLLPGLHSYGAQ